LLPTLGIGFELLLRSPVRPESLSRQAPAPGAVDFLLCAVGAFHVLIHPGRPQRGRAASLQLWLLRSAARYFEQADHPRGGRAAALQLIDVLAFVEERPSVDVPMDYGARWWAGDWPTHEELAEQAQRVNAWWCEAA
jgi:hypothetical protein